MSQFRFRFPLVFFFQNHLLAHTMIPFNEFIESDSIAHVKTFTYFIWHPFKDRACVHLEIFLEIDLENEFLAC